MHTPSNTQSHTNGGFGFCGRTGQSLAERLEQNRRLSMSMCG